VYEQMLRQLGFVEYADACKIKPLKLDSGASSLAIASGSLFIAGFATLGALF